MCIINKYCISYYKWCKNRKPTLAQGTHCVILIQQKFKVQYAPRLVWGIMYCLSCISGTHAHIRLEF